MNKKRVVNLYPAIYVLFAGMGVIIAAMIAINIFGVGHAPSEGIPIR